MLTLSYKFAGKYCLSLLGWAVFFLFFTPQLFYSQNLIRNPSFEQTNNVIYPYFDTSETQFIGVFGWFSPAYPRVGGVQSDTLEKRAGTVNLYKPFKTPTYSAIASGNYFTPYGIGKSFSQTKLIDSLNNGCYYRFSFYGLPTAIDFFGDSLLTAAWCSSNRLGAYFSKKRIFEWDTGYSRFGSPFIFNSKNYVPQVAIPTDSFIMDTTQWHLIKGRFRAKGGERYLTMGNFYSMANTRCKNFRTGHISSDTSSQISRMWNSRWLIDDLELIKVLPPDSLLVSSEDTSLCSGDTAWLKAKSADKTMGVLWDDGSTDTLRAITKPGIYWVQLQCGCDVTLTDTIILAEAEKVTPIQMDDIEICENETFQKALPDSFSYYLNGDVISTTLSLGEEGFYSLEVESVCSTYVYDFEVTVESCETKIFIPSAFSPNGDGLNERFAISVSEAQQVRVSIFSRWGQRVFYSQDPQNFWDGTVGGQPAHGTFTYLIEVKNRHGNWIQKRGMVTVLR